MSCAVTTSTGSPQVCTCAVTTSTGSPQVCTCAVTTSTGSPRVCTCAVTHHPVVRTPQFSVSGTTKTCPTRR
ncbi:hypothetical protein DPMN_099035 [Dreissena polymorpha]|uniref:Uncharacterized protein n=1 Tax=Dreissena polymorpha TaxID=45954 RepID=A0A9D4LD72_DREPO|nr:hypothetical protein DPMN_099035 [Dreissena polymorpha]